MKCRWPGCGLPAMRCGMHVGPLCSPHGSKYSSWKEAEAAIEEQRELAARLPLGDRPGEPFGKLE